MSVLIHRVQTALQQEYRKAGGILIADAVERAQRNVGGLAEQCLERIDEGIALLVEQTVDPHHRPQPAELVQMHGLLNDMLACCAPVQIAGLVETLYAVGRLVGALMSEDVWLDGTLTPAVNLLRLVRGGAVAPEDLRVLIAGIDQCATRVGAQSAPQTK